VGDEPCGLEMGCVFGMPKCSFWAWTGRLRGLRRRMVGWMIIPRAETYSSYARRTFHGRWRRRAVRAAPGRSAGARCWRRGGVTSHFAQAMAGADGGIAPGGKPLR